MVDSLDDNYGEELSSDQIREKRKEEWMSNFTPCPDMKKRIQDLEKTLAPPSKRSIGKPAPSIVNKLVKTFTPQPGFYDTKTPRTLKAQQSLIEELTRTFESNTKPVKPRKAVSPINKQPVSPNTVWTKSRSPAHSPSVVVPKVAGFDYMGAPQVNVTSQRPLGARSLVRQRLDQLKLSAQRYRRKISNEAADVKSNLFQKGRRYSDEELSAPQKERLVEPKPISHPPASGKSKSLSYSGTWRWLVQSASDFCSPQPDDPALSEQFNKWYNGRLQLWSLLFEMRKSFTRKMNIDRDHTSTLQKLHEALSNPVETDIKYFEYHRWSAINESAQEELAELMQLWSRTGREWDAVLGRLTQSLGAQMVYINKLLARMAERKLSPPETQKIIWGMIHDEKINTTITEDELRNLCSLEHWLSGDGPGANNSRTARLWSDFLKSNNAEATLICNKHTNKGHFKIRSKSAAMA